MAETTVEDLGPPAAKKLSLPERLRSNPVMIKELRSRMRGRRAFIILTVYVLVLSLLVGAIYLIFRSNAQSTSVTDLQSFGKIIFGVVVWMELLTVSFVTPALTAGAISTEREHQTYDILRVTLLPAESLVGGKFTSALLYILLLLLAAIPLQSLSFLFGGVAPAEFWIASLLLVVTAINLCAAGIFFSSFLSRTLTSTVFSYGYSTLVVFGIPMIMVLGAAAVSRLAQSPGLSIQPAAEALVILMGWLISSFTPIATGVVTELLLIESQSAFISQIPLSNGTQLTLLSPWMPFVVIYLLSSLLFLAQSIRFVRRKDR